MAIGSIEDTFQSVVVNAASSANITINSVGSPQELLLRIVVYFNTGHASSTVGIYHKLDTGYNAPIALYTSATVQQVLGYRMLIGESTGNNNIIVRFTNASAGAVTGYVLAQKQVS